MGIIPRAVQLSERRDPRRNYLDNMGITSDYAVTHTHAAMS